MANENDTNNNFYNHLWNTPGHQGHQFWKDVIFKSDPYNYQERVFDEYLKSLEYKIHTHKILELGAGKGRMTKIILNSFSNIFQYDIVDISYQQELFDIFNKSFNGGSNTCFIFDVTSEKFRRWFAGKKYSLIIASEIFMHIKPEDIRPLIYTLSEITTDIISIDWPFDITDKDETDSNWCFRHDYQSIFESFGGKLVARRSMEHINQNLWHYRFGDT